MVGGHLAKPSFTQTGQLNLAIPYTQIHMRYRQPITTIYLPDSNNHQCFIKNLLEYLQKMT